MHFVTPTWKPTPTAIHYSIVPCPLGKLLVAGTERGICAVSFDDHDVPLRTFLAEEYPGIEMERDDDKLRDWTGTIVRHLQGKVRELDLPVDVPATPFQRRVWQELCKIPYGKVTWYCHIAERLGKPLAIRAVARACATNPVALVVPCHRVVAVGGDLRGFRWGLERKRALIEQELRRPVNNRSSLDKSYWLEAA